MNNSTRFDYVVVGSGLSALVFGALAAQSGARVNILEAHEHPGGYGHTFSMGKSAKFNAQFHYVWNCGPGETVHQVLSELGLADSVTFEQLDPDGFDHMHIPGYSVKIPGDRGELARRLRAICPAAESSIDGFLERVETVARGLDMISSEKSLGRLLKDGLSALIAARHMDATLQDVFDTYKLPPPIQGLLASQWHDFLLPPERLSFFAWVMLFTGYQRGAWYPTHHFEHVIESLVRCIRDNGGVVELEQEVTGFVMDAGQVRGVEVKDRVSGAQRIVLAEKTISNMDPKRTADMVGQNHFSNAVQRRLRYGYSPSNFMIYCTVSGINLRDYGLGRWNTFYSGDVDINAAFNRMYHDHDYSNPSFALTTPGLMTEDKTDRPQGQEIIEVLTVADHAWFETLLRRDRREYLTFKKEIMNNLFDVIEREFIPDFRSHLTFKVAGTPTTNERFCWSPAGNSYGADMTPASIRSRVPNDSSVPGLYFCNATSGFPGFAGSFWNGRSLHRKLVSNRN